MGFVDLNAVITMIASLVFISMTVRISVIQLLHASVFISVLCNSIWVVKTFSFLDSGGCINQLTYTNAKIPLPVVGTQVFLARLNLIGIEISYSPIVKGKLKLESQFYFIQEFHAQSP